MILEKLELKNLEFWNLQLEILKLKILKLEILKLVILEHGIWDLEFEIYNVEFWTWKRKFWIEIWNLKLDLLSLIRSKKILGNWYDLSLHDFFFFFGDDWVNLVKLSWLSNSITLSVGGRILAPIFLVFSFFLFCFLLPPPFFHHCYYSPSSSTWFFFIPPFPL